VRTTLNFPGGLQLASGAAIGAAAAISIQKSTRSRFALAVLNAVACILAGAIITISERSPGTPMLFAAGMVAAAAPITLALAPTDDVRTTTDAVRYLRRVSITVILHVIYGICFATLGFFVATAAAIGFDAI
jgi:hypothetical protein